MNIDISILNDIWQGGTLFFSSQFFVQVVAYLMAWLCFASVPCLVRIIIYGRMD